jgi:Amt family ammonium transporter
VRSTSTVLGGVALLWLGAFGLNVGSEGVIDGLLGTICLNTVLAPAVAAVAWSVVEVLRNGRATLRGAVFGVLAGIVAITPACNILSPLWTVLLGLLAGAVCAVLVSRKPGTPRYGGAIFAVPGIHLVGGALGLAYIGLFATGIGWKDTGQPDGLADQAGAAAGVAAYAFTIAFAIAFVLERTVGVRPPLAAQRSAPRVGLDNPRART